MNSKRSITILATIAVLVTLGSTLFFQPFMDVKALTYTETYATVPGVLSTDSYVLFPYLKKDLTIGFSKYGEMIDGNTKTGLLYGGEDPFAPHYGVVEWNWINGWIINITYVEGGLYMNRWALALYSDYWNSSSIGGNWKEGVVGGSESLLYLGGRKTNGGAHTEPIQVLYDGPRRFVALLNTTIYEDVYHETPLVSIIFTIIFNKDKKQVILLKDVKRIDEYLKNIGDMQIEFGDRGEWDLGRTGPALPAPKSYAHIYENQTTKYTADYQDWYQGAPDSFEYYYDVCQIIDTNSLFAGWAAYWPKPLVMWVGSTQSEANRKIILETMVTQQVTNTTDGVTTAYYIGKPYYTQDPTAYPQYTSYGTIVWQDDPMVFVDNTFQANGTAYLWDSALKKITFQPGYIPADDSILRVVYKSRSPKYGTARQNDMTPETGTQNPFLIGEWAWKTTTQLQQFRGVTVYGVTDRNDGDDDDMGTTTHDNVLDREVMYYLNETFNPFDLNDAVHKQEYRWVDIDDLDPDDDCYIYNLTRGLDDKIYFVNATSELAALGWTESNWTGYYFRINGATGSSGDWVNTYQNGSDYVHDKNWAAKLFANTTGEVMLKVTPTPNYGSPNNASGFNEGYGPLGNLLFSSLVDFSFWYKITECTTTLKYGPHIEIKLAKTPSATDTTWVNIRTWGNMKVDLNTWTHYMLNNIEMFLSGTDADHGFYVTGVGSGAPTDSDGAVIPTGTANSHSFEYWTKKLRDFYVLSVAVSLDTSGQGTGNTTCYVDDIDVGYLDKPSGIRYERVYNMEEDKLYASNWGAYCTFAERVLVDGVLIPRYGWHNATAHQSYYTINFTSGEIKFYYYSSGYKAWNVKGKHIKVLYSTIEENDKGRYEWIVVGKPAATVDSLATAYVVQAFDSIKAIHVAEAGMDFRETTWGPNIPYVMSGPGTGTRTDYVDAQGRPHLRDDWCTTWPVASSNMIFMAGPRANLGTEYMNEFTNVFYPRNEYVVNNSLSQSNTIFALTCWNHYTYGSGYGVISVYKDLNGTIGLVFWGIDAQDFYYTCQWFWHYPAGITCPDNTIVYSGIEYLQHENHGVTDIILHIDYTDPTHPTVCVADYNERLGTISEKGQHDP